MWCALCECEQVKVLGGENGRQKQELRELQARLCQEEQKEEEARREAFTLKQRVLECDAGREAALNEVEGLREANIPPVRNTCRTHADTERPNGRTRSVLLQHRRVVGFHCGTLWIHTLKSGLIKKDHFNANYQNKIRVMF